MLQSRKAKSIMDTYEKEAKELERALVSYECQHTRDNDGDALQLVDLLSTNDTTIKTGQQEIELLADYLITEVFDPLIRRVAEQARQEEREACAKIAEEFIRSQIPVGDWESGSFHTANAISIAIREQGK